MNDVYQRALNNTLASQSGDVVTTGITFQNNLPIPVFLMWVSPTGELIGVPAPLGTIGPYPATMLQPGASFTGQQFPNGVYIIVVSACSGGFIGVLTMEPNVTSYTIDSGMLLSPNGIGNTPQPNRDVVIPGNGPLVMVAAGTAPNGNAVTREQYWQQSSTSYMLAAGQTNTVGYTTTTGTQSTSSSQSTVASSLGASASAGWGPFSASVSASVSVESSTLQQFTASTESTQYQSVTISNTTSNTQMYLIWQLMDIVTVYAAGAPLSSIINAQTPTVIEGPYDPTNLAPAFAFPELPDEDMKKIPTNLRRVPRRRRV